MRADDNIRLDPVVSTGTGKRAGGGNHVAAVISDMDEALPALDTEEARDEVQREDQ